MDIEKEHFNGQQWSDQGFLQSEEWRLFQEATGRKTHHFETDDLWANIVEHTLPIVGKYWYMPRGPVLLANDKRQTTNDTGEMNNVIHDAEKTGAGWVRIEPSDEEALQVIQKVSPFLVKKAPHDMQPKENLIIDISLSEADILAQMKPKTRYNIRLAEKKGVNVFATRETKYQEKFLDLIEITAKRDGIVPHPRAYYRKMFEILPESMLTLFVAEQEGDILAANTVLFFERSATYLHGSSSNEKRSLMAPYLLQWRQIVEAKNRGCRYYDFGGVKIQHTGGSSWEGITRFKTGFALNATPTVFPGTYDIVLSKWRYSLYRVLQWVKGMRKALGRK